MTHHRPPATWLRRRLHGSIPSHFEDPLGLAWRIARSGSRDAWFAALSAGLRVPLAPLDLALGTVERSIRAARSAPTRPVLIVTGPPRSGTTLLHQALVRCLPVAYVTNLMAMMPRSPLTTVKFLPQPFANARVRYDSFYGRTRSFRGPSDGLELWDAWLGPDRRAIPTAIPAPAADAMRRFFAGLERISGRPVVVKNNALLGCAHLIAEALPTSAFVCLRREPRYLAQSLLTARRRIHRSDRSSYGIDDPTRASDGHLDPAADVARQVRFLRDLEGEQQARVGVDRFRVVDYEAFCAEPAQTVRALGRELLQLPAETATTFTQLAPFRVSRRRTLGSIELERLDCELARRGLG